MPNDLLTHCLVALLSQSAEQQAIEIDILLNGDFANSQLVACLRAADENCHEALPDITQHSDTVITGGGLLEQCRQSIQIMVGGGGGAIANPYKKSD